MSSAQPKRKTDFDAKMKEAETYRVMGLFAESLSTYQAILTNFTDLEPALRDKIQKEIGSLKKEIADEEEVDKKNLSTEEISQIKKSLKSGDNISITLDSASAFKELGLFTEALSEYEKIIKTDYPLAKYLLEYVECNFKVLSPDQATQKIKKTIQQKITDSKEAGKTIFVFGLEIEKRGHNNLALDLFQSAGVLFPQSKEIQEKLAALKPQQPSGTGSKYEYLLNQKLINVEQLKNALNIAKKSRRSVEFILMQHYKLPKEEIGKSLSLYYGVPFKAFDAQAPTPIELIGNLKKAFLVQSTWVPLSWNKGQVEILVDDPGNLTKTDSIKSLIKARKVTYLVGLKEDIDAYINRFFDDKIADIEMPTQEADVSMDEMDDFISDITFEEEDEKEESIEEFDEASGQVVKLVDQVIVAAYRKNASDIHIEPSPITKVTSIRFRMDGVCQEYIKVPNTMVKGLISRIKIMSGLDIAERRLPQDGKIKFKRKGIPAFEIRVATLPTAGGYEDAVLRVLGKAGTILIDDMELSERNLKVLKQIINQPFGLILAVGPTGSGKTTSLHAILNYINKPGVKIWTAEDPIEITQLGLRQVEVRPKIGLDFARVMRSFLRADPDKIMIGEMRDHETASIAIEASLTGHLVLSTLHTNSAPETLTRILDMGMNALNFSDSFRGVLAQRLVRRLCTNCREEYHPTDEEIEDILAYYGKEDFQTSGLALNPKTSIYRTVGCASCSNTGYKGRLAIHELMEGTPLIKKMIKKAEITEVIAEQARKDGMTNLRQDGIWKVLRGITDLNEIRRVCIS
jgi:type II secretory ATPase GspE/PulE/Tfp pilus assembly ATPase PilB-like protein